MFEKDDLITWKTHLFLIMYMSYEHQWLFGSENTNNIKICSFKKIKTSKFVYTLLQIRSQKKNIELKKKKDIGVGTIKWVSVTHLFLILQQYRNKEFIYKTRENNF